MLHRIVLAALALAASALAPVQAQVNTSGTLRTGGVYRASPPNLSDLALAPFRLDSVGALVTTLPDGSSNTLGAKADAACTTDAGTCSAIALAKRLNNILTGAVPASQAGPSLGVSNAQGVVQQDGQTITLTGSAAGALTNGTYTTGAIPTAGYQSASIQLINAGGNTVTLEGSNDLTNWVSLSGYQSNNVGTSAPSATSSGASVVVLVPLTTLYVRQRVSTYVSGTVTAVVGMKVTPIAPIATYVTLGGGINSIGSLGAVSGGSGLTTVSRIVSAAASTNATLAKSSGGRIYKITGYNNAASLRWLKLYNKNTAPVPGTDTPFFQLPLPPGAFSFDAQDIGYYFSAGIGYAITTGEADNDNNPLTATDIKNLNVWYQ